jgi:mannose/fructose/N-acetylgalactosamine-specific phosphotransferase system component IIB
MSIILYRVDDRLIHGQVTVGWARALQPDTIIIVDDEVASNPWEVKLFQSAVPEPLKVVVWSKEDAVKNLPGAQETDKIGFLLTRDLKTMADLVESGTEIPSINLGGLHFSHNKIQILPYISFSSEDIAILEIFRDRNIEIDVRDVPTTEKKDVFEMLREEGLLKKSKT